MNRLLSLIVVLVILTGLYIGLNQSPPQLPEIVIPHITPQKPLDGSLLFWDGGLLVRPISHVTGSTLTHAAIILYDKGQPFVYEAVPPVVHKIPLNTYLESLKEHRRKDFSWFIIEPKHKFTKTELRDMKVYAESQIGRKYQLRGWWKGYEIRGIFCSQLVGNILEKSGLIKSDSVRESPGSLYRKILPFYKESK